VCRQVPRCGPVRGLWKAQTGSLKHGGRSRGKSLKWRLREVDPSLMAPRDKGNSLSRLVFAEDLSAGEVSWLGNSPVL
jgi:hypothetical protein